MIIQRPTSPDVSGILQRPSSISIAKKPTVEIKKEVSHPPPMRILARKPPSDSTKSLEQREEEYAKARARIFNDGSTGLEDDDDDDTSTPVSQSTSTIKTDEHPNSPALESTPSPTVSKQVSTTPKQDVVTLDSSFDQMSLKGNTGINVNSPPPSSWNPLESQPAISYDPRIPVTGNNMDLGFPPQWNPLSGSPIFPMYQQQYVHPIPGGGSPFLPSPQVHVGTSMYGPQYQGYPPMDVSRNAHPYNAPPQQYWENYPPQMYYPLVPTSKPLKYDYSELACGSSVTPDPTTPLHILELSFQPPLNVKSLHLLQKYEKTCIKKLGEPGPILVIFKSASYAKQAATDMQRCPHFTLIPWQGKTE